MQKFFKGLFWGIDENRRNLWRFFLIFFLTGFLIINWQSISWVFNPQAVERKLASSFEPQEQKEPVGEAKEIGLTTTPAEISVKEDSLEIPEIKVKAPLIFPKSAKETVLQEALKKGVIHYPDSALPGDKGAIIFLGHSAIGSWPKIYYDWVFSDLDKLKAGDKVFVYFKNREFVYKVKGKYFLDRGEELPKQLPLLTNQESVLFLISCWPPGQDLRRVAVEATLK